MDETVYCHARVGRAELKRLAERSDAKGLVRLSGHVAALLATGALLGHTVGTLWAVPATFLHGAVLTFLFAPLHECIHRTAFRTVSLNDVVAWICGGLLVLPPEYFRYFHFAHHRHTQDAANDPELGSPKPRSVPGWLLHLSGLPYWRAQIAGLFQRAFDRIPAFVPRRGAAKVRAEARILIAAYALVAAAAFATGSAAPLVYWVLPALAGQPLLRVFLLAEHWGCGEDHDMLNNTRTTLARPLTRFFSWNMPYHAEHHAFPAVPFHALPTLHATLRSDLRVVAPGYLSVQRAILASYRRSAAARSEPAR